MVHVDEGRTLVHQRAGKGLAVHRGGLAVQLQRAAIGFRNSTENEGGEAGNEIRGRRGSIVEVQDQGVGGVACANRRGNGAGERGGPCVGLRGPDGQGGVGDEGGVHQAVLADLCQTASAREHAGVNTAIASHTEVDRTGPGILQHHAGRAGKTTKDEISNPRREGHVAAGNQRAELQRITMAEDQLPRARDRSDAVEAVRASQRQVPRTALGEVEAAGNLAVHGDAGRVGDVQRAVGGEQDVFVKAHRCGAGDLKRGSEVERGRATEAGHAADGKHAAMRGNRAGEGVCASEHQPAIAQLDDASRSDAINDDRIDGEVRVGGGGVLHHDVPGLPTEAEGAFRNRGGDERTKRAVVSLVGDVAAQRQQAGSDADGGGGAGQAATKGEAAQLQVKTIEIQRAASHDHRTGAKHAVVLCAHLQSSLINDGRTRVAAVAAENQCAISGLEQ